MRRALIFSRILGVPILPPEVVAANITAALDALNTGNSLVGHWPMSTTAARIGPADLTVQGTHETTGLPEIAAGGGNSRALDGLDDHATIALTSNADFLGAAGTVLAFIQPDSVDVKASVVNLNSSPLAGSFSLEVEAGGGPRVFKRHADSQSISIVGSAGLVVPGRPWIIASTWGTAGLRLYLMGPDRAPGEINPNSNSQTSWPSNVPATQAIYVGRWQASEISFYDGVIGHLCWFNRQLSLAELETLAPLLRQVSYVPSFNAGSVQEGATVAVSLEDRGHPINGFTAQVASQPLLAGSTAAPPTPPGMTVNYSAGQITVASVSDSFGVTITANGQVSAPATVSLTVTDTPVAQPPQVFNHSYSVFSGSTTELNVLDNATNKPANPNLDLTSSLSGLSVINDNSPTARLRYVAPSVTEPTPHVRGFKITGPPDSNTANVTITVNPVGSFTPFAFVTQRNPTTNHNGGTSVTDVRSKPPFTASDPSSTFRICPMSRLKFFRITGTRGQSVLLHGTSSSGLVWPQWLKAENAPPCFRAWNSDTTLLVINETKSNDEPSNACKFVIIDVTGKYSPAGTKPWTICRATTGLPDGLTPTGWFWDPTNPLRAYACHTDGMYEWWPIGVNTSWGVRDKNGVLLPAKSVGRKDRLFTWPPGYTDWTSPRGGRARPSINGQWYFAPVRRNSDGKWGGIRLNLQTGADNDFVPNPDQPNDDDDRAVNSTSSLGTYGLFEWQDLGQGRHSTNWRYFNMTNGVKVGERNAIAAHYDWTPNDGVEYTVGFRDSQWRMINPIGAVMRKIADDTFSGVQHVACSNYEDTFERFGPTGGSSTGIRYCMASSSTKTQGIFAIRLGNNDVNQFRYIIHPRTIYDSGSHGASVNAPELHPHISMRGEYITFNSNWCMPNNLTGGTDLSSIQMYVVVIPDAWRSPLNSGLQP